MSTNIPRITQKIFAQNAAEDDLLQFGSVLSGNATPSTSIAETQTEAYQTGWRSAVIPNRNYPTLGEMNAVQQVPTQQLAYLFQKGIAEWDASTTYFANVSYCQVNGVLYQSVSDNNIGNNPTTDNGTNWIIADLSNKITNCILSAPNGVATYSGNTITVKAGLKVLIPNGRNADKTLKNVEYTVSEDKTVSPAISTTPRYFGLLKLDTYEDYDVFWVLQSNYYESTQEPSLKSTTSLWINPDTKVAKWGTTETGWQNCTAIVLGAYYCDNSAITSLIPYQPVELAKEQDLDGQVQFINKTIADGVTINAGASKSFSLSSILPNDGCLYEMNVYCIGTSTTSKSGDGVFIYAYTNSNPTVVFGRNRIWNNVQCYIGSTLIIYAKATDSITFSQSNASGVRNPVEIDVTIKSIRKVG